MSKTLLLFAFLLVVLIIQTIWNMESRWQVPALSTPPPPSFKNHSIDRGIPCQGENLNYINEYRGRHPNNADRNIFVTGRFGRPGQLDNELRDLREYSKLQVACLVRSGTFDFEDMFFPYGDFPQYILEDTRYERHRRFLQNASDASARGAGYWFWKSLLIQHHLAELSEGGFLVYSDIDRLDVPGYAPQLLEAMVERNADLALELFYPVGYKEYEFTTKDVYDYFNVSEADDSDQYNGSFIVVRKNRSTMKFLEEWAEAMSHYELVSDERDQDDHFIKGYGSHRHDQSMLSMLIKYKYGEPHKTIFEDTPSLTDWTVYTFALHAVTGTAHE